MENKHVRFLLHLRLLRLAVFNTRSTLHAPNELNIDYPSIHGERLKKKITRKTQMQLHPLL